MEFVIERKKYYDLIASIGDGRFTEQKFRLKKSQLKNVIYLIEGAKFTTDSVEAPVCSDGVETQVTDAHLASLLDALSSVEINDGFSVVHTSSEADTIDYIARLTKLLQSKLEVSSDNLITGLPFEEFSAGVAKTKNLAVQDVFAKQLIQFPKCTAPKALEIIKEFPTVTALYNSLSSNKDQTVSVLKNIEIPSAGKKRKLGEALATSIASFYSAPV